METNDNTCDECMDTYESIRYDTIVPGVSKIHSPDRPRVDTAGNTAVHTSHGVWVHSCSSVYGILVRIPYRLATRGWIAVGGESSTSLQIDEIDSEMIQWEPLRQEPTGEQQSPRDAAGPGGKCVA